ncbi:uncharacterized protein [Panulirus ornatus]|uniref:uncharacterized protein n=1 Tax=Panulirus ornatus TaxID=150431 RepID=UPI003A87D7C9
MTRELQRLTVAVAVVVATATAVAAVPKTPAPPRTIDPRYPDNIVQPKVICLEEGYFHHPRNCSWYFRCEDKMKRGYFFTTYYECAPGTVFDDALDVCVFPYQAGPPCGGSLNVRPPIIDPTPIPTPRPPTPPATTLAPTRNCSYEISSCRQYEICQPTRETKILCIMVCTTNVGDVEWCDGEDGLYDLRKDECVARPTGAQLCPATTPPPSPTVTIDTANTLRCSHQDLRPAEDWIFSLYCDDYVLCDSAGKFQQVQVLCSNFYQCRTRPDGSWTSELRHCLGDFKYSYEEDRCLPIPSEEEQC